MPFDDASSAAGNEPSRPNDEDHQSVILELRAAADAAASQARKMAATASTEARISIASIVWMASAMMLSVALLISAWGCIVGLGVWFAIDAGWPVSAALLTAALANVGAAGLCRLWYVRLSHNIGFPRTLSLLFGPVSRPHGHS